MRKTAVISDDKKYRYYLERRWDINKGIVCFIMLNPSTADAEVDDPTIRRCVGFAKSWGYGGIIVVNLYALRSTDPKNLLTSEDPIGPGNIENLIRGHYRSRLTVCAWGNGKIVDKIQKRFPSYKPLNKFTDLHYLDLSIDGTPKHPLYLKSCLTPLIYENTES